MEIANYYKKSGLWSTAKTTEGGIKMKRITECKHLVNDRECNISHPFQCEITFGVICCFTCSLKTQCFRVCNTVKEVLQGEEEK